MFRNLLNWGLNLINVQLLHNFASNIGTFLIKLHANEEKKLSNSFWEINILSDKLTTMTTDDDEQLGIRKVPLHFGWRS